MDTLALHLALHGTVILTASFVAGLLLHKAIRLAHAGVSARGVLLIALAAILPLPALAPVARAAFVVLILAFVWTSTAAMVIAASTGQRGLTWHGSTTNRLVFALYVASALTAFPAAALLLIGFLARLRTV
jgi:hypothetical protein